MLLALLVWLAPPGDARSPRSAAVGKELRQCANGTSGIGDCITVNAPGGSLQWISGNLGQSNSRYREGDYVPFRVKLTNLVGPSESESGHTYTLKINYDAVDKSLHTYDYLGTYNASENWPGPPAQQVIPCGGVADTAGPYACGNIRRRARRNLPSTLAVPKDPNTHFPSGSAQADGQFSAWGASLENAVYDPAHSTPIGVTGNPDTVERQIDLTFTADGPTAVVAWGGHLASVLDWGQGNTFKSGGATGSSFHMRLKGITDETTGETTYGNEDLSINVNAIAGQPLLFTTQVNPASVPVGQPVVDTATLTGTPGVPVTGEVRFFVCGLESAPPNCSQGGAEVLPPLVVLRVGLGPDGTASIAFTPTEPGHYCFRAEYTPSPAAPYSPALHTNTTSECFVATGPPIPPTATLEVKKACDPTGDSGHFKLLIETTDGQPVKRQVVTCGGTTGPIPVQPGSYRVRERGANGTDLTHYNRFIGGACEFDGSVTVQAGDAAVCTIMNVHKGTQSAELTVTKICVPADDGGRFNLTIDGQTSQNLACGGSFGPVSVPPGQHHVSESAGTGTSLSDYATTIGGDCAADGTVTLAAGQLATCTITNVRAGEQTGTVEIEKQCSPADAKGRFQLEFDGKVYRGIACGDSTGPVVIGVGNHQIGEVSASNISGRFETTISGDCSASGSFTLSAGQHVTCVITNTLVSTRPPLKPPPACYTLSVRPRTVRPGGLVRVLARVHLGRLLVPGIRVYAVGPGVSAVRTTGLRGRALFLLSPRRRGTLHVSIRKAFDCPKRPPKAIGVVGTTTPQVTG